MKLVLRQHIRYDWRNNVVYIGVVHAVRAEAPGKGRALCGRSGPRAGQWEVARSYQVNCVRCLRKYEGLRYHGDGNRNQYDKRRSETMLDSQQLRSALANAHTFGIPVFKSPRFFINEEGEIVVLVHKDDKVDENIAAIVNLGKWDTLAADVAERGIRQEASSGKQKTRPASMLAKLKAVRSALGFSY